MKTETETVNCLKFKVFQKLMLVANIYGPLPGYDLHQGQQSSQMENKVVNYSTG